MTKLSVLLPARDAGDTLPEALDCLSRQRGFGENLEILVADDGSRDATLDIAQAASMGDSRIRILALPRNGLVPALNAALQKARGRFIARMDADDLCSPERMIRQLRHMERHPGLDVVGTQVELIPGDDSSSQLHRYVSWQNSIVTHRSFERNLLVEAPLTHGTAFFRREALEQVHGWRKFPGPEDQDLWLRGAAIGWRFGKVNACLYGWRDRRDSLTRNDPRYHRDAFRRLAVNAFARGVPPGSRVSLWGWGDSLRFWDDGLRDGGFPAKTYEVNPRALRGGAKLPPLPSLATVRSPGLRVYSGSDSIGGESWLLAFGSETSRSTMRSRLYPHGYFPGRQYRFVS